MFEEVVGLGMALDVRRGVGAYRSDGLTAFADVVEHTTHELGSEVLAAMLRVCLDMWDRHDGIVQREAGEPDH